MILFCSSSWAQLCGLPWGHSHSCSLVVIHGSCRIHPALAFSEPPRGRKLVCIVSQTAFFLFHVAFQQKIQNFRWQWHGSCEDRRRNFGTLWVLLRRDTAVLLPPPTSQSNPNPILKAREMTVSFDGKSCKVFVLISNLNTKRIP